MCHQQCPKITGSAPPKQEQNQKDVTIFKKKKAIETDPSVT